MNHVLMDKFFTEDIANTDPAVAAAIASELGRQRDEIELIASENIVSHAVLQAQGSVLTNKYAEGYPGRRYYGGCQFVDVAEELAIARAKELFGCAYANVQPQFREPGQPGCVHGPDEAWRHLHGAGSRRRWPSDARRQTEHVGQVVQCGQLRRAQGRPAHRHERPSSCSQTSTARS